METAGTWLVFKGQQVFTIGSLLCLITFIAVVLGIPFGFIFFIPASFVIAGWASIFIGTVLMVVGSILA